MAAGASKKCGLLTPDYNRIGCYRRNSLNLEQVPGNISQQRRRRGSVGSSRQTRRVDMGTFGARFAVVTVMLVGLLLLCSQTSLFASSFPNDTYAHYGKDGSTCSEHMDNNQAPPSNGNMVLCIAQSGATKWWAEVKSSTGVQVCNFGDFYHQQTVASPQSFPCPITATGYYRGYLHWFVGGSIQMNSTDQWFKK